MNKVFSIVK